MRLSTTEFKIIIGKPKKKYGFLRLLWDLILTFVTGGLWLIWLLIRYLRNH